MRIFTTAVFVLNVISLFAQNFEVAVNDTTAEDVPGAEIVLGGHIINLTDNSLIIEITRETNDIPANWTTSLCLDVCVAPWVNTVSGTIPANDSVEFSIHFFTDTEPGVGEALLVFKEQRSSESESYLFTATTSAIGIFSTNDREHYSFRLLGNYPNPFNNSTIISFQIAERIQSIKLQIYSILGQLVFEKIFYHLPIGENQIYFKGNDLHGNILPGGIYIYRLSLISISGKQFADFGRFTLLK